MISFRIKYRSGLPRLLFFILLTSHSWVVYAQNDLMDMLESTEKKETTYTKYTFKSSRIINGHSIETVAKNHLDFRISHRFGRVNSGAYNLWGLDQAIMKLFFDYGLTDRLTVGVGRATTGKTYDGYAKYKLLRQSSGARTMPITVVVVGGTSLNTMKPIDETQPTLFVDRMTYFGQLLIARKFSERLSLQVSPTVLHRNLTNTPYETNLVAAVGIGGRFKISKRTSLNAEYFYVLPNQIDPQFKNTLSVGVDIETGGHVFQLHFTNSLGMVERQFLTETTGAWGSGDIHYGFNLSRTFSFDKKAQKPTK